MVDMESAEIFRQLPPAERALAEASAQPRTYPAGQEIFREGDPGDGLYVVLAGSVEISGQLTPDRRQVFSTLQPGQIFGEMAIIEALPRSACATARQATTVAFLDRATMQTMIERSPTVAGALLQLVSHRLREFNQHYLQEVVQTERLAAVGRFARSIIHDLKNPLSIITLTTEMLPPPEAKRAQHAAAVARISKQLDRINDLIADMLHFTQSGTTLILRPVNFADYVESLLQELRPDLELRSVTLQSANPPPAITVNLDTKSIRRVFHNLTHNAAEAVPAPGLITLRFTQTQRELITEIADNGPGLPAEIMPRLFEPFVTHGKDHGTGLGLSICKKIITDHGGRISARNQPNGGALFSFTLPVA
jgi:signal transduction histidine kinase